MIEVSIVNTAKIASGRSAYTRWRYHTDISKKKSFIVHSAV